MLKRSIFAALALAASAAPALAHVGPGHTSLMAGLAHPLSGADHLIAMLAVGIWAAQLGGRARFAVPAAFLALMVSGFGLAVAGVALPFVEPAILATVIGLGLLVAAAIRVPAIAAMAVVSVFALFHGHAHGTEIAGASALAFAAGFAAASAALHLTGVFAGSAIAARLPVISRIAGGAAAVAGVAMIAG